MTEKPFNINISKDFEKITIHGCITPVSSTRKVTYDISKMIEEYISMGKTREEAIKDFEDILEEVCRELSEERGFNDDGSNCRNEKKEYLNIQY